MEQSLAVSQGSLALRRVLAVVCGAALVAAAAQIAVPIPGTPVPVTLQPLAVLIVGGLLGPALGASSLVLYLALGATGLPVFTPFGAPGIARLFGPTGGYLLSYPLAAAIVGRVSDPGRKSGVGATPGLAPGVGRTLLAVFAGLVVIYLGGALQLVLLTGSARAALALGALPFVLSDIGKLAIAVLVLKPSSGPIRARL